MISVVPHLGMLTLSQTIVFVLHANSDFKAKEEEVFEPLFLDVKAFTMYHAWC